MNVFRTSLSIFIYTLAALFLLYEMAVQVSPSIMTYQLMRDFQIGTGVLGVMASFYFYSYTLMQIPAGLLFDRFGPRILITLGAGTCALGAFSFGLTTHVIYAACGRFLMGLGSAFAFIGVLTVASRWFHPKRFALLVGIAQLLAAVGALGGELPLAALVNFYGWRVIMVMLGVIGLLLTLFCFMIIRNFPDEDTAPPKQRHHLFEELREVMREKQTWWIALYAFMGWGPVVLFAALWGVPYLMVRYEINNTGAALSCGMIWIGIAITAPIIGWLSDKISRRRMLLIICSAIGLLSSLAILYLPWIPYWVMFFLLFGVGIAAAGQIVTFAIVKDINRPSITSTAIGLNNMAVVAGGALFQPLVGFLIHSSWTGTVLNKPLVYSLRDYHFGLILLPLCFLGALVASCFFIKETYCKPRYDPSS